MRNDRPCSRRRSRIVRGLLTMAAALAITGCPKGPDVEEGPKPGELRTTAGEAAPPEARNMGGAPPPESGAPPPGGPGLKKGRR